MTIEKLVIQNIIKDYHQAKRFRRRIFGAHQAIQAVDKLLDSYRFQLLEHRHLIAIIRCFITHPVTEQHASHRALRAILSTLRQKITTDDSPPPPAKVTRIENSLLQLISADCIDEQIFETVIRYPDPLDMLELVERPQNESKNEPIIAITTVNLQQITTQTPTTVNLQHITRQTPTTLNLQKITTQTPKNYHSYRALQQADTIILPPNKFRNGAINDTVLNEQLTPQEYVVDIKVEELGTQIDNGRSTGKQKRVVRKLNFYQSEISSGEERDIIICAKIVCSKSIEKMYTRLTEHEQQHISGVLFNQDSNLTKLLLHVVRGEILTVELLAKKMPDLLLKPGKIVDCAQRNFLGDGITALQYAWAAKDVKMCEMLLTILITVNKGKTHIENQLATFNDILHEKKHKNYFTLRLLDDSIQHLINLLTAKKEQQPNSNADFDEQRAAETQWQQIRIAQENLPLWIILKMFEKCSKTDWTTNLKNNVDQDFLPFLWLKKLPKYEVAIHTGSKCEGKKHEENLRIHMIRQAVPLKSCLTTFLGFTLTIAEYSSDNLGKSLNSI